MNYAMPASKGPCHGLGKDGASHRKVERAAVTCEPSRSVEASKAIAPRETIPEYSADSCAYSLAFLQPEHAELLGATEDHLVV